MKYMFGRLASGGKDKQLYARSVSYVRFGTQMIFSMIATAENTVWIHPFCSEMNVLIDNTGEIIEQIDYKRKYGNAIIEGKRHIITSYSDKSVVESTELGLVTVYSTVPFIPFSVCQSRGGGLLVSLIEGDRSDITSLTKGEVHHVDLKGSLIKRYAKEKDSDSALFTWPHKVAQNVNLDLCVLDSTTGKEGNILKIISVDGRPRFTYSGHPGMETGFIAGDVVCDSTGRILVTDHLNNNIHVLSADGDFLHYLIKAQDDLREPCSLSLYDDTLWVGCRNGTIRNYRIKLK
ncbi:hypothetical protein FSP39_006349 [Pinctada imbricata]|uniref:Tripartite motif-containing protein 2 n=1 Tax=Pinctada imbricata TaxID=66713 RepID=A0AA88Y6L9_PINIB|nr:hypothetical protein FSP39_006349 [Pinctada imbricata]